MTEGPGTGRRRREGSRRRLPALAAVVFAATLLAPAEALAHAVLTHSTPHASATVDVSPQALGFDFNEPVETSGDAVRLFDGEGTELPVGDPYAPGGAQESVAAAIPDQLDEGVYTATYRVISADGHPVSGGFSFGVGVPVRTEGRTAPPVADLLDRAEPRQSGLEVAYGVVRGIGYLALLVVVGAIFLRLRVWRRGDGRQWPTRTLFAAAAAGAAAAAAGVVLQSALVAGVGLGDALDRSIIREGLDTRTGEVWAIRLGLWLGLMLLISWGGAPGRLRTAALVALTVAAVATVPLGGHAATHSPEALLVGADLLHVIGAGAWLGALVLLLVVYWPRRREEAGAGPGLAATSRFSGLALPAIVALAAAGLLQSWFYLDGSPGELLGSGYGILLVAKLALLGLIVALAAANRRRLARRDGTLAAKLRRAMRAEVVLAIAVLGVTAALVRVAPPASAGGPQTRQLDVGDVRVEMIVEPATTGPNDYHLYLFDRETGAQVRRVKDVTLRLTQPEEEIGPITLEVPYESPAHYELLGPALGVPGTWEVALDVRFSRFDLETARTEIEVRRP